MSSTRAEKSLAAASGAWAERAWLDAVFAFLLVALTRIPLWGNFNGEADTARYVFGLRFWTELGPATPVIINRDLSTGYYWLSARLAAIFDVPFSELSWLLGAISVVAALITAPALYYLGTFVVSRRAALVATIGLLLGPAWWWVGFQGHPQGLTLALQLLSLVGFMKAWSSHVTRPSPAWLAISAALLTASLLVKTDAILLFPAYLGLRLFQRAGRSPETRGSLTLVLGAVAGVLGAAYAAFTVIHRLLTGPLPGVAGEATTHIKRFLSPPDSLGEAVAQVAPILFAPGPAVMLLVSVASAVFLWRARSTERWRWLILIATWSVPGYLFWLAIAGNNARHVIPFAVPLFWLGFAALEQLGARPMVTIAAAALLGNLVVPANSGLALYPSANVPASAGLMQERQQELRAAVGRLLAGDAPAVCYVGRTTQDYVAQYVLEEADAAGYGVELLPGIQLALVLRHPDGRLFRRVTVIGLRDRQDVGVSPRRRDECLLVESLEYDEAGRRHRFFGTEGWLAHWVDALR